MPTLKCALALGTAPTPAVADPDEIGPRLHRELGRLPERLRAPLVLCHLESLTHEQAAAQLGWPVGTVKSRMARGRDRLRDRLGRDSSPFPIVGVAPPASLLAATARAATRFAAGRPIAGMVPASALSLTQGVLRAMWMTQARTAGLIALALGFAATAAHVLARPSEPRPAPEPAPVAPVPKGEGDIVTYQMSLAEMKGLQWRTDLHRRLKPVDRRGPYTVWAVDEATLRDLLAREKVVAATKFSAFLGANVRVINQTQHRVVSGYRDPGAGKPADAIIEVVPDGVQVQLTGRRTDAGLMVRAEVESNILLGIGDTPVTERVARPGVGVDEGLVHYQVPEIIQARFEGEWPMPAGGALVIGLGIHRFNIDPFPTGREYRERLVIFKAREIPAEAR